MPISTHMHPRRSSLLRSRRLRRPLRTRLILGALVGCVVPLLAASASQAKVTTFGSPLSQPATLQTGTDLAYQGTNTNVPASPEAPTGVVHTYHFGADTALWNVGLANGDAQAPATGQALKISVEGCAEQSPDGTPPLTQIHFQDLTPLPGGGAKVNITSQPFNIPVCGAGGASGSTVSTYEPINLCVSAGDYIDFNDEGGFVGHSYQNGVPFRVIGRTGGSKMASFIRGGGTNNGDALSSSDTSAMDGYAGNANEELLLRVTLGTGADATHICPGGKAGLPPALAPIRVSPQTDGVNHARIVAVALFCRVTPCKGTATITDGSGKTFGQTGFSLTAGKTTHLPIRVQPELVSMIRRNNGVSATLDASVGSTTITQKIGIKIF
jgi:hypothetical protein